MRRVVIASICTVAVWFGVMGAGGGMFYKGEAAKHDSVSRGAAVSREYESLPALLGGAGGGSDESGLGQEKSKSSDQTEAPSLLTRLQDGRSVLAAFGTEARSGSGYEAILPKSGDEAGEGGKVVYLTIDDGPSKLTPQVLDILQREDVKATFFLLGEQVEQSPQLAARMVEDGHAIGNHTYDHRYEKLYGSFEEFGKQVMRTDDAIFAATGVRTTLLRAPGGTYSNFDQGYFDALAKAGYQVHDWNVDSGDSKRRGVPAAEIVSNIKNSKLADTLNVLLHDSAGHEESVKALPSIISYYKGLGYTFKTLDSGVKPMQFTLANQSKWKRGKVTAGESASLIAFGQKLEQSGARDITPLAEPDLTLYYGDQTLVLYSGQYSLMNGSLHVPLMPFTEWMGGAAERDGNSGVVEASLSGKHLLWMGDESGSESSPETEGNLLDVPLRAMLEKFGYAIRDYKMGSEHREVWIEDGQQVGGDGF